MGEKEEGAELEEEEDGEPRDGGGQGSPGGKQLKSAAPLRAAATSLRWAVPLVTLKAPSLHPPPTLFPTPSHHTQFSQD